MKAIIFGQSGVQHTKVRDALLDYAEHHQHGRPIHWLSVEEELSHSGGKYTPLTSIISKNDRDLHAAWTAAFHNLLSKAQQLTHNTDADVIISTHACIYRANRFVFPADVGLINSFEPNLCLTLIDDLYDVWYRLRQRYQEERFNAYFRLDEIAHWRTVEIGLADFIARSAVQGSDVVKNYVFAVKHTTRNLYRLLFERDNLLRLYACCPITRTRTSPTLRYEIDTYRSTLQRDSIVFDPLTIDEVPLHSAFEDQFPDVDLRQPSPSVPPIQPQSTPELRFGLPLPPLIDLTQIEEAAVILRKDARWPLPAPTPLSDELAPIVPSAFDQHHLDEIALPANEVAILCARRDIDSKSVIFDHITQRDLRMIDQSELMPAWRPRMSGVASQGQAQEIAYMGSGSIIYWPPEDGLPDSKHLGPTVRYCDSEEEFYRVIRSHAAGKQTVTGT